MPNIKSAKKRVLVNESKRMDNKVTKSVMRTSIRKLKVAIAAGDKELATSLYGEAAASIDKAAGKGVIHKNNAANKKSGLQTAINRIGA